MAFIYCITNIVNNKQYVGKTTKTIEKRFREHCKSRHRVSYEKRPLYSAMIKYGLENFKVEQLIECSIDELNYYEEFFINKLDTYKNGYNATKGGDGKIIFDHKKIIELYKSGLTYKKISEQIGCSCDTVSDVIRHNNIPRNNPYKGLYKQVIQIDKITNQKIRIFESISSAALWLAENGYAKTNNGGVRGKISLCCRGKFKTAYQFKWIFN